jgi:hypothetical protein
MGLRPNLSDVIETFDVFYHHNGIGVVRHFGAGMNPRDNATSYVFTNFEGNRRTLTRSQRIVGNDRITVHSCPPIVRFVSWRYNLAGKHPPSGRSNGRHLGVFDRNDGVKKCVQGRLERS